MNDRDHLPVDVFRAHSHSKAFLIPWPVGIVFFLIALVALLAH